MKPKTEANKIKVSIDLHGVIDEDKEKWESFARDLYEDNNKVYILTGSSYNDALDDLNSLGFDLTIIEEIISTTDYLINEGYKWEYDKHNRPSFELPAWWGAKAELIKKYNIELHFDNESRYKGYFWPGGVGFIKVESSKDAKLI